jgi:hypothetical protein
MNWKLVKNLERNIWTCFSRSGGRKRWIFKCGNQTGAFSHNHTFSHSHILTSHIHTSHIHTSHIHTFTHSHIHNIHTFAHSHIHTFTRSHVHSFQHIFCNYLSQKQEKPQGIRHNHSDFNTFAKFTVDVLSMTRNFGWFLNLLKEAISTTSSPILVDHSSMLCNSYSSSKLSKQSTTFTQILHRDIKSFNFLV